jgi:hypothetical protein
MSLANNGHNGHMPAVRIGILKKNLKIFHVYYRNKDLGEQLRDSIHLCCMLGQYCKTIRKIEKPNGGSHAPPPFSHPPCMVQVCESTPQKNDCSKGPTELDQHFRVYGEFTSAQERCLAFN